MAKASRTHHGDEFGKLSSGSSTIGVDPPACGYGAAITLDGIVEKESGVTPPPPPFSVRTFVIAMAVIFVIGLIGLWWLLQYAPVPVYR